VPDDITYVPGAGGTAVVGQATVLLLAAGAEGVGDHAVTRLWESVRSAADVQDVVDAVLEVGLRNLPSFGLLHRQVNATQVLLRGDVRAVVSCEGAEDEVVTAEGAVTWRERAVAGAAVIELTVGDGPAAPLRPLLGGVVESARIRVGGRSPAPAVAPASAASAAGPAPQPGRGGEAPAVAGPAGSQPDDADPRATLGYMPDPEGPEPDDSPAGGSSPSTEGVPGPGPEPGSTPAPGPSPAVDEFDALFGETQFRSLEGAAVRPAEEAEADGAAAAPVGQPATAGAAQPADAAAPADKRALPAPAPFLAVAPQPLVGSTAVPPVDGTGPLIDAVPGMPPRTARSAEVPIEDGSSGAAAVAMTSSRPRSRSRSQVGTGAPPDADGPTVTGVLCPAGHANPPQLTACRVCGHPLGTLNPVSMRRPVLGVLVFSNGTEVVLDRSVIVGRAPKAERVSGNEIPQLVTVPSPDQEISRNHLEVRLEGWHVVVVDLDSTNGTVVTLPGKAPERLRAGEECPITPGTVVSVADEVTFEYKVDE
jgi:hypothetical protein